MAALSGIKYDDGSGAYVTNCFPVRSINSVSEEGSGAWLVEHRAEQRKEFKALLCAKPRTFEEIRHERRRAEKNGTAIIFPPAMSLEETEEGVIPGKVLDGFFLMKLFCVDDPSDLCSINISGQQLSDVKEEDFCLFDNIAYVNAAENFLTINQFKRFVTIRELELPLNGIRGIEIVPDTFPNLEMLDLSYNNLAPEDILPLSNLRQLKVLHLTGNGLHSLPADLAGPVTLMTDSERDGRFHKLEILLLDDNSFSNVDVFAALAGLRNLKHLNLSKNLLYAIPQLVLVRGQHVPTEFTEKPVSPKSRKSQMSSGKTSSKATPKPPPEPEKRTEKAAPPADDVKVKEETKDTDFTTDLPEDLELTELNLTEIDARVEEELVQEELEREQEALATNDNLPLVRMPFPQLRYLNVAFNKVEEEEHILAVSTWPMLTEMVIHDNPLTNHCSHMPQLLQMFLADQLGIHVQRKKNGPIPKPVIDIPQKPGRKVSTAVERVPKCTVEELLALESGPLLIGHGKSHDDRRRHSLEEPLQEPIQGPRLHHSTKDRLPPIRRSHHMTGGEGTGGEEQPPGVAEDASTGEAFFMTQLLMDEMEGKTMSKDNVAMDTATTEDMKEMKKKRKKPETERKDIPDRYKGYELLLDIDESALDPDIPIPKDLHGNVRALRYMLEHPLVYRENTIHLERRQKPFEPYQRRGLPLCPKRKMRSEQIEEVLSTLRNRTCVIEAPLKDVLAHPKKYRKDFGNARQLLTEVQRKFNAVRENSMKDARREMKNIVSDTIKIVEQLNEQQPAVS